MDAAFESVVLSSLVDKKSTCTSKAYVSFSIHSSAFARIKCLMHFCKGNQTIMWRS